MPSWSEIIGGEVSFTEKLNETWSKYVNNDESEEKELESEPEPEPEEESDSESDEWWYGEAPALKWPRPEPIRMADMVDSPTIEVSIYHQGTEKAAEVVAVYAEFMLRDAWGDSHSIEVVVEDETLEHIETTDEFFSWGRQNGSAKDANLLVADGGGWNLFGGGSVGVCGDAEKIAKLHGDTLFVNGDTAGHDEVNTGLHELLHQLGFSHGDGGKIAGAITPMGHYANTGSTYSARVHDNVKSMTPEVQ
jgi:hypothetical protein